MDCISANDVVDSVFFNLIFCQDVGENLACSNTSLASQESNQGPKLLRFGVRSFFWKKAYRTYCNWGFKFHYLKLLRTEAFFVCVRYLLISFQFYTFFFWKLSCLSVNIIFLLLQGIHEQLRVREPEPAPQPACEPREPRPPLLGRLQPGALPQACVASSPKFRLHNWKNLIKLNIRSRVSWKVYNFIYLFILKSAFFVVYIYMCWRCS